MHMETNFLCLIYADVDALTFYMNWGSIQVFLDEVVPVISSMWNNVCILKQTIKTKLDGKSFSFSFNKDWWGLSVETAKAKPTVVKVQHAAIDEYFLRIKMHRAENASKKTLNFVILFSQERQFGDLQI